MNTSPGPLFFLPHHAGTQSSPRWVHTLHLTQPTAPRREGAPERGSGLCRWMDNRGWIQTSIYRQYRFLHNPESLLAEEGGEMGEGEQRQTVLSFLTLQPKAFRNGPPIGLFSGVSQGTWPVLRGKGWRSLRSEAVGPATSTLPGNLLKMQNLKPLPQHTDSETVYVCVWGGVIHNVTSPPGDCHARPSLKATEGEKARFRQGRGKVEVGSRGWLPAHTPQSKFLLFAAPRPWPLGVTLPTTQIRLRR